MKKSLILRTLEQDKLLLGICRGIQSFNGCLGGTLCRDLPAECLAAAHAILLPYDQVGYTIAFAYRETGGTVTKQKACPNRDGLLFAAGAPSAGKGAKSGPVYHH